MEMFENLSDRLGGVFSKLRGKGRLLEGPPLASVVCVLVLRIAELLADVRKDPRFEGWPKSTVIVASPRVATARASAPAPRAARAARAAPCVQDPHVVVIERVNGGAAEPAEDAFDVLLNLHTALASEVTGADEHVVAFPDGVGHSLQEQAGTGGHGAPVHALLTGCGQGSSPREADLYAALSRRSSGEWR